MAHRRRGPTTRESLREYSRGIAGGFLFSLPLILTMEVWAAGVMVPPARLLAGLAATYVLLCGYNAYAGLHHETRLAEIMVDSVEELGIGLTLSALILLLFGRIDPGSGWAEMLGLTVVEGLFVAVGVSVGTAQLMGGGDTRQPGGRHQTIWSELVLAICGAVLIAANVGPTEEILLLASSMSASLLLATMGTSLLLAVTLLYFSHFAGGGRFADTRGVGAILRGSAITYAAALVASAAILWFFGRFAHHGLTLNVALCVVLGVPGTLGASAGRLLLR
jgi:putative integral membrane protein (TIGR02587 family)